MVNRLGEGVIEVAIEGAGLSGVLLLIDGSP